MYLMDANGEPTTPQAGDIMVIDVNMGRVCLIRDGSVSSMGQRHSGTILRWRVDTTRFSKEYCLATQIRVMTKSIVEDMVRMMAAAWLLHVEWRPDVPHDKMVCDFMKL